jgi:hypothetical protein
LRPDLARPATLQPRLSDSIFECYNVRAEFSALVHWRKSRPSGPANQPVMDFMLALEIRVYPSLFCSVAICAQS